MTEQGVVVKLDKEFAVVRIGRNSACATCGKCGMTQNQKHVDFYTLNTVDAQVDDVVEVDIPEQNTVPIAFVGYIVPIIPALLLMFLCIELWGIEWLAVILFFVGLGIGFVFISILDKIRRKKWINSPTITRIVLSKQQKTEQQQQ